MIYTIATCWIVKHIPYIYPISHTYSIFHIYLSIYLSVYLYIYIYIHTYIVAAVGCHFCTRRRRRIAVHIYICIYIHISHKTHTFFHIPHPYPIIHILHSIQSHTCFIIYPVISSIRIPYRSSSYAPYPHVELKIISHTYSIFHIHILYFIFFHHISSYIPHAYPIYQWEFQDPKMEVLYHM